MNVLRLLPVILSFVLLAAHFSRNDMAPLIVVSLAVPFFLLLRRPWIPRLFQLLLVVGALEWIRTLVMIARRRQAVGDDWMRMALILGVVALVTALSALVFRSAALRRRYGSAAAAGPRS